MVGRMVALGMKDKWTVKARKGPSRIRVRVRAGAISSYLHCG